MNLNNFTIKSQEAIQQALTIAHGYNHQSVEPAHLLKGIISQSESITGFILRKLGVNPSTFDSKLTKILESYPKVSGGEQFLSSTANRVLQKAIDFSHDFGDQYVSIEHILQGLLSVNDQV
jgi:ATP-dependent Clp protease ATP-binding subunit ClpB